MENRGFTSDDNTGRKKLLAEIICVGDEVIDGTVQNTNAHWLARELSRLGVTVLRHVTVRDKLETIVSELKRSLASGNLVFMTGGLGPTEDDLTHKAVSTALGLEFIHYDEARLHVETYFKLRGKSVNALQNQQFNFPATSHLLSNPVGTALGAAIALEDRARHVFTFPGVPKEMIQMFETAWLPYARKHSLLEEESGDTSRELNYYTVCLGESDLVLRVEKEFSRLKLGGVAVSYTTYLFSEGVRLKVLLKTKAASTENEKKKLDKSKSESLLSKADVSITAAVERAIGAYIYSTEPETLSHAIVRKMESLGVSLATAESCTGGKIASMLTSVSGASKVFRGSLVTYQSAMKTKYLGVTEEEIAHAGVVSQLVARKMALGCRKATEADLALSVTGFAGPQAEKDRKVGQVCFGLSYDKKMPGASARAEQQLSKEVFFGKLQRSEIIDKAAVYALKMLYDFLSSET